MVLEFDCTCMNEQNTRQTQKRKKKVVKKGVGGGYFHMILIFIYLKNKTNNLVEMGRKKKD